MDEQGVVSTSQQVLEAPYTGAELRQRNGFRCSCGTWFRRREELDEHMKADHPDLITVCECCKRVLPKGHWTLDQEGNFTTAGAAPRSVKESVQ